MNERRNLFGSLYRLAFVVIISCISCQSSRQDEIINPLECLNKELTIIPHYYETRGRGNEVFYRHCLYLKGYEDECFNYIHFKKICQGYLDTVNTKLPVSNISYYKSVENFPKINDEQNWEIINEDAIVAFTIDLKSSKAREVEINSIIFYQNGEGKRIVL